MLQNEQHLVKTISIYLNFVTIWICSGHQLVWRLAETKCVLPVINSKKNNDKFAVVAHVLQNAQNLVISRCSFAEEGKEMFKDL